jgi:hypothetical protein
VDVVAQKTVDQRGLGVVVVAKRCRPLFGEEPANKKVKNEK